MRRADVARLVALAMIWSASFVFMRVLAPALGPLWIAASRVLIGGGALVAWFAVTRFDADLARHWRAYLVVGVLNSALPFALYGYAAAHLPASYMALLNAATPLFAVLAAAIWLGEPLTALKIAGVAGGAAGVALVSRAGAPGGDPSFLLAVAACLVAAASYALAGAWLKRNGAGLKSLAVAGWSQLLAGVALLPFAAAAPAPGPFTPALVGSMLALGLVCSGVAYILYYRLMVDVGPAKTLTVAFLIPFFAVLWGALFLGEAVTLAMLAGGALIVGGTAAVLRPAPVRRAAPG